MTRFTPSVWKEQGDALTVEADNLYRSAEGFITTRPTTGGASPIDTAAQAGDAIAQVGWHRIAAGTYEAMTSFASRMRGTGDDYATAEEQAANERFWQ